MLLAMSNVLNAQSRWSSGYTKGRYVAAGRTITVLDRTQLANLLAGNCAKAAVLWQTMLDEMESQGREYPDTIYFEIAWVLDSVFYARADTNVVPWASDLYAQVYLSRGHGTMDSATRQAQIAATATRRRSRSVSRP